MITRRQFCGVLGGTVLGGSVLASWEGAFGGKKIPPVEEQIFASKVHLEQWYAELRHKPPLVRLDALRKRFADIRENSDMVLFVGGAGISNPFHEELILTAKGTGLRILTPAGSSSVAALALEEIRAETTDFTTLAFPLAEIDNRFQIVRSVPSPMVCGYLYSRCFGESLPSVPLAVILFETSRCLWETYVSQDLVLSSHRSVSRDNVDREYAKLIDQTCVQFS